jgi:hypothetical protein
VRYYLAVRQKKNCKSMLIVLVDHVLNYNVLSIIDGARYGYIRPSQKTG